MSDGTLIFDTKILQSGFTKGVSTLGKIGVTALKGMVVAAAAVTTAVAGIGVSAIKTGMEFESQMSRVQAISGATTEELKKLNDQAIKLGADTAFSALDAAAGMENLASAGFTANEIMAAMPGLLDLAAVSGGDVAAASEVAAAALNAFGLAGSEAGHVADVFAQAAASTNAEALDMGEAMKYVAPISKAMGLSLEETAAAIGIMSDAGIKGGQAGTALRGALSRLAKPTKVMKDTMDELGLSFYDAQGNMLPLNETVAMLKDKLAGLTQEQQNQALVTLFGQEALSGMLALIGAGPEALQALTGELVNSDGAAAAMAATMTDNLKGSLDELSGSFDTFKITLFQSVDTPLKDVVDHATELLNGLTEAFNDGGLSGALEYIKGLIMEWIDSFVEGLPKMLEAGSGMMTNLIQGLLAKLPELIPIAVTIITNMVNNMVALLPMLLDAGMQMLSGILHGIIAMLPEIIPTIKSMILSMVDTIISNLPTIIDAGMEILFAVIDGIVGMLPELITQTIDLIILIADKIIENLPLILDAGIKIIMALVQGIIDNLPKLILEVPRIINAFADAVYAALPTILAAGVTILWELIKGIVSNIPNLIANAWNIIKAIINVFTLGNLFSAGKGFLKTFDDGIWKGLKSLIDSMLKFVSGIIEFFKGALSGGSVLEIGKNLVTGIWNGINNAKGWVLDKIKGFGAAIIGGIKSIFGIHSPSTVLADEVGAMLPPGIAIGFQDAMPDLQKKTDKEMSRLTGRLKAAVSIDASEVGAELGLDNSRVKQSAAQAADKDKVIELYNRTTVELDGRVLAETDSKNMAKGKKRRAS